MPFIISILIDFERKASFKEGGKRLAFKCSGSPGSSVREKVVYPTLIDGDFSLGKWVVQVCSSNVEREPRLTKPRVPQDGQGHYKTLADEETLELAIRKVEGEFR